MSEFDLLLRTGVAMYRDGRVALAEPILRRAVAQRPDDAATQWALGLALLMAGKYAEGWPLLNARRVLRPDNFHVPSTAFPEWRGEPLAGKRLLVMTEQGCGDQIMFARFVPQLRAQGAAVTLVAWREVAPVLAPLADAVVPAAAAQAYRIPPQDLWTHYFTLPERLGVTLETLPAAPYLQAPADRRPPPGYEGRAGLFWRTRDPERNIPEPLAAELLARGFVSLQPEDTGAADFADTAAILAGLRLVVTIDTAVAHLAGAMGKPVLILVPPHGEWRWMEARADSPWYPTARLLRRGPKEPWDRVIAEIEAALAG